MKRDFLTLTDLSPAEIENILDSAASLKADRQAGRLRPELAGKNLGLIFEKPSMRTRVSFEVGLNELGARAVFMMDQEVQLSRREPIPHAARVLSRYLDGLIIRTFAQKDVEDMGRHADVPVINALTDMYHPCQLLADLLTVKERKGTLKGIKSAWVGDGNNMANSWLKAAGLLGFELALAVPEGYDPDLEVLEWARSRTRVNLTRDPAEAVAGADVVSTDVWASMGQEDQAEARAALFKPFQVNAELMARADPGAIALHCLPAHLGQEITEEVIEGPQSAAFDQAENRLHAQKALLVFLFSQK